MFSIFLSQKAPTIYKTIFFIFLFFWGTLEPKNQNKKLFYFGKFSCKKFEKNHKFFFYQFAVSFIWQFLCKKYFFLFLLHPSHPENLSPVWASVGKDPLWSVQWWVVSDHWSHGKLEQLFCTGLNKINLDWYLNW